VPDAGASRLAGAVGDLLACVGFFTRLRVPAEPHSRSFAAALWAAPLAGAGVGLLVGCVLAVALALGVPTGVAAGIALACGLLATGALHEDGLADVADGFGGGRDREAKLAIMRDSRIGTYGVAALTLSLLVRWAALAGIGTLSVPAMICVLVAVHAASRAIIPSFLAFVPPARPDGLGAGVGRMEPVTGWLALAIGGAALMLTGPWAALVSAFLLAVVFFALARLCRSQIGGQTGDVLGALQQAAEIAILIVVATELSGSNA
jgi:adenosylcobinamide-GDP ribazoletransferase